MKKSNLYVGRLIIFICLLALVTAVLCSCSGNSNPYLPSADIDITLRSDGGIDVKETHVVDFSNRGEPWWNYFKSVATRDNSSGGYTTSEVTDLKVKIDGREVSVVEPRISPDSFTSADKRMYADMGYLYRQYGYYEVGVFMTEFYSGIKTLEFSYTVSNVMIEYADCAAFYYKFVDEENEMDYKNVTATVHFNDVTAENVNVWTHLEYGNGEGIIPDGNTVNKVEYRVEDLIAGEYFETRILLPSDNYDLQKYRNNTREEIKAEESKWQSDYALRVKIIQTVNTVDIVIAVIVAVVTILLILLAIYKRRPPKIDNSPEYLREIPIGWSAGEVAPIYHYYGKYDVSDAISATILELFRRKFINIEVGEKKKSAEITVIKRDLTSLAPHERTVYLMLTEASGGAPFTMKEFEKRVQSQTYRYAKFIDDFKNQTETRSKAEGYLPDKKNDKFGKFLMTLSTLSFFGAIVLFFVTTLAARIFSHISFAMIACILAGIAYIIAHNRQKQPLTKIGQAKHNEFKALGKFMTEFSNMDKHELPSLILWEEYMVYATAMGIADKVAEQLEIAYPEYKQIVAGDTDTRAINTFGILYFMSPRVRIRTDFMLSSSVNSVCKTIKTMQTNARIASSARKFSSGMGRGGGFGGGGGGFGGGGSHAR